MMSKVILMCLGTHECGGSGAYSIFIGEVARYITERIERVRIELPAKYVCTRPTVDIICKIEPKSIDQIIKNVRETICEERFLRRYTLNDEKAKECLVPFAAGKVCSKVYPPDHSENTHSGPFTQGCCDDRKKQFFVEDARDRTGLSKKFAALSNLWRDIRLRQRRRPAALSDP